MTPTPDTVTGIIFIAVGAVLLAAALVGIHLLRTRDDMGGAWGAGLLMVILGGLGCLPALIVPLVGFAQVGFDPDYTMLHPVHGQVQQIASRQVSAGRGMAQRFVVTLDGQPYAVNDTRAALLKPGDTVGLVCAREFEWGSTDNGWACMWGAK